MTCLTAGRCGKRLKRSRSRSPPSPAQARRCCGASPIAAGSPSGGHAELFTLAEAAKKLHTAAPGYVADLYEAAFTTSEPSDEPTQMMTGVVALRSTRRQDYNSGLYSLAESFPDFLRAAPAEATRALIAARRGYAAEHGPTRASQRASRFEFRGQTAEVVDDYSLTWDSGSFDHDDEVKLLNAFEQRLEELADTTDGESIEMLIETVAGAEVPAAIWRRVLRVTAGKPEVMAPTVIDALISPVLLTLPDTQELAAIALVAAHPRLQREDQEKVDEMISGLPQVFEDSRDGEEFRDRLLAALSGRLQVPAVRDPSVVTDELSAGWLSEPVPHGEPTPGRRRFDELLA